MDHNRVGRNWQNHAENRMPPRSNSNDVKQVTGPGFTIPGPRCRTTADMV